MEIQVRSSESGATTKDISIELQSSFPNGPEASHWLSFALEDLAIPIVCVALGFWVAMVRIRDKLAWPLLVLLLSFAEMFGAGGATNLYGRTDLLQPMLPFTIHS